MSRCVGHSLTLVHLLRLERISQSLITNVVATMLEEAQCILAADPIERYPDGFDQCLVRTSLSFTQDILYLSEGFLYGREVGRIGR